MHDAGGMTVAGGGTGSARSVNGTEKKDFPREVEAPVGTRKEKVVTVKSLLQACIDPPQSAYRVTPVFQIAISR